MFSCSVVWSILSVYKGRYNVTGSDIVGTAPPSINVYMYTVTGCRADEIHCLKYPEYIQGSLQCDGVRHCRDSTPINVNMYTVSDCRPDPLSKVPGVYTRVVTM